MIKSQVKLLILLLVASFTVWNPEFVTNIFTPIFNVPFVAKIYISILYSLSTVGIYSDPLIIFASSIVPLAISAFVVHNVVKGGRTLSGNPKSLFGFVKYDYVGLTNALLVMFALCIILLSLYSLVYFLTISENVFR